MQLPATAAAAAPLLLLPFLQAQFLQASSAEQHMHVRM
jgi:hypothetical protein